MTDNPPFGVSWASVLCCSIVYSARAEDKATLETDLSADTGGYAARAGQGLGLSPFLSLRGW